jgi:ABC-2 type transport system permease protein
MLTSLKLVTEFEIRSLLAHRATWIRLVFIEPLTYLLLLGAGLQGLTGDPNYIAFVFPGILGMQLLRIFTHSIYRLTVDRRWGLQALKITSGISPTAYLAGMQAIPLALFYLQTLVCLPLALLLHATIPLSHLPALALVGFAGSLFWTSLALTLTFFIRNYSQRDMVLTFLILPMTFSAPVFYDLANAPSYLKFLSHLNPLTYQVESLRTALLTNTLGPDFYLSLATAALLTLAARLIITRAEYLPTDR